MPMTAAEYAKLLEPGLRKVFFETYQEKPEQFSKVYKVSSSKKAAEHDYHIAGLGVWPKFEGAVVYDEPITGDTITYVHEQFAQGIQIPITLAEDDLYGIINENGLGTRKTQSLARGARALVEKTAASILDNAFTVNGYDGVPLISDAHPLLGGGTQSNKLSPDSTDGTNLTVRNLSRAIALMRKQVNDRGIPIACTADTLVVPVDLYATALEIVMSPDRPDTPNRAKNILYDKLDVVVLDYLENQDIWFLLDSSQHQLNFFWRVKPEFMRDEDIDHLMIKFVGRCRFSCGYSDYRGIVGAKAS